MLRTVQYTTVTKLQTRGPGSAAILTEFTKSESTDKLLNTVHTGTAIVGVGEKKRLWEEYKELKK